MPRVLRMLAGNNEAAMGSAMAVVVCGLALVLVNIALFCYGYFRAFTKMGLPGWQGFVPVLGTYRGVERASGRVAAIAILCVRAVAYVAAFSTIANDKIPFAVTGLAILLVVLTHAVEGCLVALRFGYGIAFGLMCGILPPVFMFILGASDARFEHDELSYDEFEDDLADSDEQAGDPEALTA